MRSLSDTIARLGALRTARTGAPADAPRLAGLTGFGTNPGDLRAKIHVPENLAANAPLVVVLHGCTQTAEDYNRGSGWSTLADREGFALLFAEQARGNNSNLCFNWFVPADTSRGQGEVQSIAQMIAKMLKAHPLDPARVFVTGLSAGGAMTSAMLATYPELFAGGAIIGGLPYACAANVPEAFDRMRGHGGPTDAELVAAVKRASASAGVRDAWPAVSVWHGTADATVSVSNMARIGRQWCGVHGVDPKNCRIEHGSNWEHRVWTGHDGRSVVEEWAISGMGHGVPIEGGRSGIGVAGPYMLAVGVSSTERIARSWNILGKGEQAEAIALPAATAEAPPHRGHAPRAPSAMPATDAASPVQQIIENALRKAGLMR